MKKAIKIILAAALFICIALGIVSCYPQNGVKAESIAVYRPPLADAAADEENTYAQEDGSNSINPDENEDEAVVTDENEGDRKNDLNPNENETTDSGENEEEPLPEGSQNGFEEIYDTVMMHISEILSLAAFIASLICAIIYKGGLIPLMNNGLQGLKNAVVKIKEATDKAEVDNKESVDGISRRIEELEGAITDMGEAFTSLREALSGLEDQRAHQMRLDTILGGELDMLYDIFMTSSLPEYEKARVGERMTKLKGVLNSDEGEK